MKTKLAVVIYLVGRGIPQNLAKASVDLAYGGGAPKGDDSLYGFDLKEVRSGRVAAEPIEMSEHAAWLMHEIVSESLTFVKGGIAYEGDIMWDMNGDPIPGTDGDGMIH